MAKQIGWADACVVREAKTNPNEARKLDQQIDRARTIHDVREDLQNPDTTFSAMKKILQSLQDKGIPVPVEVCAKVWALYLVEALTLLVKTGGNISDASVAASEHQ